MAPLEDDIRNNLNSPTQLEELYRKNKTAFREAFNTLYAGIREQIVAQVWHERLNYKEQTAKPFDSKELILVLAAAFIAGLIAKIPEIFSISEDYFYPRNIGFIVLPLLTLYFGWIKAIPPKKLYLAFALIAVSAVYINLLPENESDTLILVYIHMPLLLWSILGFTYVGNDLRNLSQRIDFLRFNGDLVVLSAIMVIAGGLLTAITIGLFSLIAIDIEEIYFQYVVVWGAAAVPIVGTYLVQNNPQLVKNVSPIIAKVFTPIVLITLIIYLIAVIVTGKDPYNDREFLIVFNLLLIGVMAIIFFAVAETSQHTTAKYSKILLLSLSVITIIINGIALSAILFRIAEWGITPNRLAVLGSNLLILTNLLLVAYKLFRSVNKGEDIHAVEDSIAAFLPIYSLWTILVIFLFPVIFNFN